MNRILITLVAVGVALATAAGVAGSRKEAAQRMERAMHQPPDAAEAKALFESGAVLLDVRSREEWDAGHVRGATFLPHGDVGKKAAAMLPDRDAPIVTYCKSGALAAAAANTLRMLGYTHVEPMTGGFEDLKKAGLKTD